MTIYKRALLFWSNLICMFLMLYVVESLEAIAIIVMLVNIFLMVKALECTTREEKKKILGI